MNMFKYNNMNTWRKNDINRLTKTVKDLSFNSLFMLMGSALLSFRNNIKLVVLFGRASSDIYPSQSSYWKVWRDRCWLRKLTFLGGIFEIVSF